MISVCLMRMESARSSYFVSSNSVRRWPMNDHIRELVGSCSWTETPIGKRTLRTTHDWLEHNGEQGAAPGPCEPPRAVPGISVRCQKRHRAFYQATLDHQRFAHLRRQADDNVCRD